MYLLFIFKLNNLIILNSVTLEIAFTFTKYLMSSDSSEIYYK